MTEDRAVAAFFDMDHTLLHGSTAPLYLRFVLRNGMIGPGRWLALLWRIGGYVAGRVAFPQLTAWIITRASRGDAALSRQIAQRVHDQLVKPLIAPLAVQRIAWHRQQGHAPVIVSASTESVVAPVAHDLGLGDAFIATRLHAENGHLTGEIEGVPCYGAGKVTLARQYADVHGIDISRSWAYSDGASDMPLLEAVGHPVAVNPDRRLATIAKRREWPIEHF